MENRLRRNDDAAHDHDESSQIRRFDLSLSFGRKFPCCDFQKYVICFWIACARAAAATGERSDHFARRQFENALPCTKLYQGAQHGTDALSTSCVTPLHPDLRAEARSSTDCAS